MSGESGRKSVIVGVVFLSVAVGIIIYSYASQRMARRTEPSSVVSATNAVGTPSISGPDATSPQSTQNASGQAQAGDSKSTSHDSAGGDEAARKTDDPFDYGRMPTVKPDANEDVKSVVEALKNKSNPERLTPLIQPKAFDPVAYRADPLKYRQTIEPGRVYQSAQPAKDTPRIMLSSPADVTIEQGQKTVLKVISAPSWPVTFVSFSGGQFANQLNCMTVEADAQGVAEVEYLATSGVIEEVYVLAASPMASGQVRWTITVRRARG